MVSTYSDGMLTLSTEESCSVEVVLETEGLAVVLPIKLIKGHVAFSTHEAICNSNTNP